MTMSFHASDEDGSATDILAKGSDDPSEPDINARGNLNDSHDSTGVSSEDRGQAGYLREASTPDILATLELLGNDGEETHESQVQLVDLSATNDPTTETGLDASSIFTIGQEKRTLGETIRPKNVPGMAEDQKRASFVLQPKPPPEYADLKPAAKKTRTIRKESPRRPEGKTKTKKRGGKGSYRCTFCGAKKENHICRAIAIVDKGTQTEENMHTEGCRFVTVGTYVPADGVANESKDATAHGKHPESHAGDDGNTARRSDSTANAARSQVDEETKQTEPSTKFNDTYQAQTVQTSSSTSPVHNPRLTEQTSISTTRATVNIDSDDEIIEIVPV